MFDLKQFRKINNLTQVKLAEYFGVTQAYLSQVERGLLDLPKEYISKIKVDGIYELPSTNEHPTQPNESSFLSIIESQQQTIDRLTRIIENLTKK